MGISYTLIIRMRKLVVRDLWFEKAGCRLRLKNGFVQDDNLRFCGLFFVAASTVAAEGVIETVRGDHEAAAGEGYQDFDPVCGQDVSPEGSGEDKGESDSQED